jgi:hypothetical protein
VKGIFNFKSNTGLIFLFFAFIAIALVAPIASENTIPNHADYINHLAALIQAKMALLQGQFPLRIAPLEQQGWGYPLYQFSSPTTYTFSALLYLGLTPNNPLIAVKWTIISALVCGGFYMYRLAYWLMPCLPAAILAGLVYVTAPYYLIVINHLGDLSEAIALGLIPFVLFYTFQTYYQTIKLRNLLICSLAWYLLLTIHLVTFIYLSLTCLCLLLLITFYEKNTLSKIFILAMVYLYACLLGMWYLAPVAILGKYLLISQTISANYFIAYKPLLSYLLFPNAAITPGSDSALVSLHPNIGWAILISAGICFSILLQKKSLPGRVQAWLVSLLILFSITFILIWSPLNFWQGLPQIFTIGQYSWRLLGQLIWIGALLFVITLTYLFKNKLDIRHIVVGSIILMSLSNSWFPALENYATSLEDFLKKPMLIISKNAYLLNYNKFPDFISAKPNLTESIFTVEQSKTFCFYKHNNLSCRLAIPDQIKWIELPAIYYPNMLQITVNGVETHYQSKVKDQRLITIIPAQTNKINNINLKFVGLQWANSISLWCWGLWFTGFFIAMFTRKKVCEQSL